MAFGHEKLDLEVCGAITPEANADAKRRLDRIVVMLTRLGQRGYSASEIAEGYETGCEGDDSVDCDCDTVSDTDTDTERFRRMR